MRTAAFTATVLAVSAALLSGCSSDSESGARSGVSAPPSASPTSPPPTPPPTAGSEARAVYWLGATDEPRGPRLYREFFRRPATAEPVRDAVQLMLSGEPKDPDYTSLWADGTSVRGVTRDGSTVAVDLSAEARRNGGGSAAEAMTLQQLVHTVTAADPSVDAVRLLVEGEPVQTLWGSADASRPLTRAPAVDVLGPVWLDVPEGGTVEGTFGGSATVFEATVDWDLRQGDRVVQEGFSTATEGAPGRGTWSAEVDVPPGDYLLRAWESSARDGSVLWLETKRVTVR